MRPDHFQGILDAQITRVQNVLVVKSEEYATEDQLANVRFMAQLQNKSMAEAVTGAMAKHTYSIYKMVSDGKTHSAELWDEKITDHIIWLILLKACLIENADHPQLETN